MFNLRNAFCPFKMSIAVQYKLEKVDNNNSLVYG